MFDLCFELHPDKLSLSRNLLLVIKLLNSKKVGIFCTEEEDSAPYRIVDLQTNISSDASGYTFLEARKPEEEHQYMKLQPICKRIQNKVWKRILQPILAKKSAQKFTQPYIAFNLEGHRRRDTIGVRR